MMKQMLSIGLATFILLLTCMLAYATYTNGFFPTERFNSTQTVNITDEEALSIAKRYLEVNPYSKKGLINELILREKMDAETAEKAVSQTGADWGKNAERECKLLKSDKRFTEKEIRQIMQYEGYTESEVDAVL